MKPSEITKKRRTSDSGRAEVTKTFSHSSEADREGEEWQGIAFLIRYTIGRTVSRLCFFNSAEYITDERTKNAIQELRVETERYIRSRFPDATEALRTALTEANARRLRRLCRQWAHYRDVASTLQRPPNTMTEVPSTTSVAVRSTLSLPPAPKTNQCPYCGDILKFNAAGSPKKWRQVPLSHSSLQETQAYPPQQSLLSRFGAICLRY